jgi:hypothetical protein
MVKWSKPMVEWSDERMVGTYDYPTMLFRPFPLRQLHDQGAGEGPEEDVYEERLV